MTDIRSAKFIQPIKCKCGHELTRNNVDAYQGKIQIVCSECHASILEIEFLMEEDAWA